MPEEKRWQHSQPAFLHCVNGPIVEVILIKPPEGKIPDWPLVHQLSRDRHRYRETLSVNIVLQALPKQSLTFPRLPWPSSLQKQKTRES